MPKEVSKKQLVFLSLISIGVLIVSGYMFFSSPSNSFSQTISDSVPNFLQSLNYNVRESYGDNDLLLIWGQDSDAHLKASNGSFADSWSGEYEAVATLDEPEYVKIMQHPSEDWSMIYSVSSTGNLNTVVWNGTTYYNSAEHSATYENSNLLGVDMAFEHVSGDLFMVAINNSDIYYKTYSGGEWSAENNFSFISNSLLESVRLISNPEGDDIIILYKDSENDIFAYVWDGTKFIGNKTLTTTGATTNHPFHGTYSFNGSRAFIMWEQAGNTPKMQLMEWNGTTFLDNRTYATNLTVDLAWVNIISSEKSEYYIGCGLDTSDNVWVWNSNSSMDAININEVDTSGGGGFPYSSCDGVFYNDSESFLIAWGGNTDGLYLRDSFAPGDATTYTTENVISVKVKAQQEGEMVVISSRDTANDLHTYILNTTTGGSSLTNDHEILLELGGSPFDVHINEYNEQGDITAPELTFVSPTPPNNTQTVNTSVQINVSIYESTGINNITYNWNGTNYTMYDSDLVLMMNFDNRSALGENDTHIKDLSLYGNNGTAGVGANYTASGKYGGAFTFDAESAGVVLVSNTPSLNFSENNGITISSWINMKQLVDEPIVAKRSGGDPIDFNLDIRSSGDVFFNFRDGVGLHSWQTDVASIGTNEWKYIAVTIQDEGHAEIYVDGINQSTTNTGGTGNITGSASDLTIGYWGTTYSNGSIDEVRIWNRSLTSTEVYQQYVSNLAKFNSTTWNLYVSNQSFNATTGLGLGNYTYQVFAEDTSNNLGFTEVRDFEVVESDTTAPTVILNTPPNNTISNLTSFNFTANLSDETGIDNATLYIYNTTGELVNATDIDVEEGTLSRTIGIVVSLVQGSYEWFWRVWDTSGNEGAPTSNHTLEVDTTYPTFNTPVNTRANGSEYAPNIKYEFNITIANTNGSVQLEFNSVNYTANNVAGTVYNVTIPLNLGADNYTYQWNAYSNNTLGNYNTSVIYDYSVEINTTGNEITPYLNGADANLSVVYPQQINASYTGTNFSNIEFTINGTTVTYGANYTWGVGNWVSNYSINSNQNYTAEEYLLDLEINQTASAVDLLLNGTDANISINDGDTIDLNCSRTTGESLITIYNNGTLINNGTTPIYNSTTFSGIGTYNITCIYPESQNYSQSSETHFVEVQEVVGGDTTAPEINFREPTPANASSQTNTDIYVNVTANDTIGNVSLFVDFDNSLVGWWRMDDVDGSGDPVDYFGVYNGTLAGNAEINSDSGYFGNGSWYDGGSDYITFGDTLDIGLKDISYGAWFRRNDVGTTESQTIISKATGASGLDGRYGIYFYDGYLHSLFDIGPTTKVNVTETPYLDQQWHHAFATINRDENMTFYIDGVEVGQVDVSAAVSTNYDISQEFRLGAFGNDAFWFEGDIDDALYFNRVLNASEVSALYANTSVDYYGNNFTGLSAGNHTFTAYTQDTSGNVNSTITRTVEVQQEPPDIIVPNISFENPTPANASSQTNTDIYVNVSSSDANDISTFIDFDDSLLAWWRMDEASSTEVYDYFGNYNCTLNGTAKTDSDSGYFGNGTWFDGDSDYVNCGDVLPIDVGNFSYGGWFRRNDDGVGESQSIISKSEAASEVGRYFTLFYLGEIQSTVQFSSGTDSLTVGEGPYLDEQWHHVLTTIERGGNMTLYLDGVQVDTKDISGRTSGLPGAGNILGFGAYQDSAGTDFIQYFFEGDIDDVMMFDRPLSSSEVEALYANTSTTYLSNNFTNLALGNHTFKAYTQDTGGNVNSTITRVVEIEEAADTTPPNITLNTPINDTSTTPGSFNFTANASDNIGLDNATLYIYNTTGELVNSTLIDLEGTTTQIVGIIITLTDGLYKWFYEVFDTSANSAVSEQNFTLNLTTPLVDNEYPQFSNSINQIPNGSEYTPNGVYQFNITLLSTNGSVGLEFNGINYTANNVAGSVYNVTLPMELGQGNYTYQWFAWGNGTDTNYNTSVVYEYSIIHNGTYVLGITGTTPITYPTATDVAGSGCPTQLSCSLDKSNKIYGVDQSPVSFNYSTSGNSNYTANSTSISITINQGTSEIATWLNNTRGILSILNATTIFLNSTMVTPSSGNVELYNNGTLINNGTAPVWNSTTFNNDGNYNITSIYYGNQNYSGDSEEWTLTVTLPAPPAAPTGLGINEMILGYDADLIKFEDDGLQFTYRR